MYEICVILNSSQRFPQPPIQLKCVYEQYICVSILRAHHSKAAISYSPNVMEPHLFVCMATIQITKMNKCSEKAPASSTKNIMATKQMEYMHQTNTPIKKCKKIANQTSKTQKWAEIIVGPS